MNHFQCMEIINYLHLFDSSGLIAKLSISQGNIPCNLCPFNIREFTLKEGVNKNFILLNPSFYLACHIAPLPLSLFMAFSFFMFCLSFFCLACPTAHSHNLPLFIPFIFFMLPHTHLFSFFYKHKKEEKKRKEKKIIWNA